MKQRVLDFVQRWLTAATWVYFTILFGWFAAYVTTGDRFGYLGQINALALYLFLPLPLVALLAVLVRRREVWAGTVLGCAIFLWLWGGLFVPRPARVQANSPTLTVMTYNVLGLHTEVEPVLDVIRAEDADVVFLQEINTTLAAALRAELADIYPYQILDPFDDVRGLGTISRYPIELTGEQLPLNWVGTPQIMTLDWQNQTVKLVHFHMFATGLGRLGPVTANFRHREMQAQVLADYSSQAARYSPLIVAGDANTTDLSTAYKIMAEPLTDAWRAGGYGFGHTFPGSDIPGSSRPVIAGWPIPQWLARIDYVFHSEQWETSNARLAQFDGVSDHRGVVAELRLVR